MRSGDPGAFQDILSALANDSATLVRKQYALLCLETGTALRRVFFAILLMFLGMTAAAAAMVFLGIALFEWLAVEFASRALAALAVSGAGAVVAALILVVAYQLLMRTSFVPRRTFASLSRSASSLFGGMPND